MMISKDNVDKYTDLELALLGYLGYLGNGTDRKNLLGVRYNKVQGLINDLVKGIIPIPSNKGGYSVDAFRKVLEDYKPTDNDYQEFIDIIIESLESEDKM